MRSKFFLAAEFLLAPLGGALIPIWSESQASPVLPGVNMKAVSESVDNRVQHKLDIFNSSFRSDIKDFVTDQIRVVRTCTCTSNPNSVCLIRRCTCISYFHALMVCLHSELAILIFAHRISVKQRGK